VDDGGGMAAAARSGCEGRGWILGILVTSVAVCRNLNE
jgi:hypothetical protein